MDGYYYGQQENGHMVEAQASAARGEKRSWNCVAESSASGGGQDEQGHVKMWRPEPSVEASINGAENALWRPAELLEQPRVHGTGEYSPPGHQQPSVPTVRCYPAVQSPPVVANEMNDGADPPVQRAALQQYAAPEPRARYTRLWCFNGNPLHWPEFQVSWRETNELYQDSDDARRRRLRGALYGDALELVQPLMISRAPPRDIYKALYRRYHLISREFFRLLKKAHDTARPAPANQLLMFFNFRNVLVELIHAFHLNKVHLVMNNTELANYLAALLPADFFRTWTLYFCNNDNVYGLLSFVQLKIYNIQRTAILLQLPDDSDDDSDD